MELYSDIKLKYERDGYVIIPNLIADDEQRQELLDASERVIKRTREGGWPHRRTVGSQFPPYKDNDDIWGVQHVMHPDLHEPSFLSWYCSSGLLEVATALMECETADLQIELFNILINPESHEFALRWHRDDVKGSASEDEERLALDVRHYGIQWNTALYDDECLYVVPGSHAQPRTTKQRSHSIGMDAPSNPLDMPGSIRVKLKAGETVVYNQNLLHCATYNPHVKRITLHACMGNAAGGASRARNILQHGVEWMKEEPFRKMAEDCGVNAVHMLDNTVQLGTKGEDLGYSQD